MSKQIHASAATEPMRAFSSVRSGILQRKCSCGGTAGLTDECEDCSKKRLQRKARSAVGTQKDTSVPPIVHEVLRSSGRPLDTATRAFLEPRFGHDFSQVRVHTDAKGAESARAVNALAYTVGRDVVFASEQYRPETTSGRQLIAHELTHVVQQGVTASGDRVDHAAPAELPTGLGHNFAQVQVLYPTPPKIQTKLTVNEPGDKYEQEADRVADEVMRMPELTKPEDTDFFEPASGPRIQRKCAECEEEELQRQPEEEEELQTLPIEDDEEEEVLQLKPLGVRGSIENEEEEFQAKESPGQSPVVTSSTQARIESLRGGGEPLRESIRAFYEPRFGVDFNRTRIHTGALATEATRSLKARAFTLGSDIFFNSGEFQPATASGKRLLAHELTHVVQQAEITTLPPREAHRAASRASSNAALTIGEVTSSPPHQPVQRARPRIMRLSPDRFQKRLGRTKDQKIVVRQLFEHPTFKLLWNWLGNCECDRADHGPIRLRVGATFGDGVQTFGGFNQTRGILTMNPNIRAARKNPQELVDTIVHEVVHAVSWAWRNGLCPGQQSPLQQLDIVNRPTADKTVLEIVQLRKPPCKRTRFPVGEPPKSLTLSNVKGGLSELEQFERSGPSASDPCTAFQDLREEPQQKIVEIVDDIQQQTGIGGPTRTRVNLILREDLRRAQQKAGGFSGIVEQAPQLRGFMQCRDEECVKPRRQRDIERCFNEVLERAVVPNVQRQGGADEELKAQ